jgi:hemerythrin superfamily protein
MFGIGESETSAVELLKADHEEVENLFKQYESQKEEGNTAAKVRTAQLICVALTVHAAIEEEIFYPAARKALEKEGKDLVDEAAVEHQSLKDIIGRLEIAPARDPLYDAGVKVLHEFVKHHGKEEENELLPKVRSSELNLEELGTKMLARKAQLLKPAETSRSANRGPRSTNRGPRSTNRGRQSQARRIATREAKSES